jgi:hypothetical protein
LQVLGQRHVHLQGQADELRDHYTHSLFDVKKKSSFRGLLLEKKLRLLHDAREEKEAQIYEALSRARLEPSLLSQVPLFATHRKRIPSLHPLSFTVHNPLSMSASTPLQYTCMYSSMQRKLSR